MRNLIWITTKSSRKFKPGAIADSASAKWLRRSGDFRNSREAYDDAQLAQLWLQTHTNPNRPLTPAAAQLIERYGELFAPRQLRCRHCLALRYGEIKHDA